MTTTEATTATGTGRSGSAITVRSVTDATGVRHAGGRPSEWSECHSCPSGHNGTARAPEPSPRVDLRSVRPPAATDVALEVVAALVSDR